MSICSVHIDTLQKCTKHLIRFNGHLSQLCRAGKYLETLHLFHHFRSSNQLKPDHYTFSAAITSCANLLDTTTGAQLHAQVIRTGFKFFPHVANTLLSLFAKSQDLNSVKRLFCEIENPDVYSWTTLLSACTKLGDMVYACEMFDKMPKWSVAVWNAMITGCGESGYEKTALNLFCKMHVSGVGHDHYSLSCILCMCSFELLDFGIQVHSLVIKTGFLARPSVVNALLTMYFKCEMVGDAYKVFNEAESFVHDQISYNVMISGLASMERDDEAFLMFHEMLNVGLNPTELTFVSIMSSCNCTTLATQVHGLVVKVGLDHSTLVSNAAMTMYANCGNLIAVDTVFQNLKQKDVITWNVVITSHANCNLGREASMVYLQMRREGIRPDEYTIGSLLVTSDLLLAESIHASVIKDALIQKIEVSNALLSAFSKHGLIELAHKIFIQMDFKNLISWNTLINGYQLNGLPMQGLDRFSEFKRLGHIPSVYTLSIVISICTSISAVQHGEQVHASVIKAGYSSETCLGNALITFYAKCGILSSSLRVFQEMIPNDTVSWNSMISAYCLHGEGNEAVKCFELMQHSGVKPDKATFTALLSACSHSGLIDDGSRIFNCMVNIYGIEPEIDHFSCVVDLLGRAGYVDVAEGLLDHKHLNIHPNVWWTLISSCAAHGNLRVGRICAKVLLETEKHNPSVYVLLSNIYAEAGNWEESANLREQMTNSGVLKQRGSSWISSYGCYTAL